MIKFLVRSGKKPAEIRRSLHQVWGDKTLSETQVRHWCCQFKDAPLEKSTKDAPHTGRKQSKCVPANIQKIRDLISGDGRLSIADLCQETGLSYGTVQRILTKDLKMSRVCAKFVPRILTEEQKRARKTFSQTNLDLVAANPMIMEKVISGDETWISTFEPETKQESSVWKVKGSQRVKKPLWSRSQKKTMLTAFFDVCGVVHHEFLQPGETVKSETYCATLSRL